MRADARPSVLALLCVLIGLLQGGAARAAPGEAFVALQPAPQAGEFDAGAYLADPSGFPARAAGHPDGWALLYRAQAPPAGWARPFEIRAGGRACCGGGLHPRYALALAEMLGVRRGAILTLRAAPDSIACAPGKPGPQPFQRDGWLFLHDGVLDIEEATEALWNAPLGGGWEAFKADHPRDYHGNGHATRGNASEIYFLVLLYEISRTPEDVAGAFQRALHRLLALPDGETLTLNALLQRDAETWALRWTGAGASADYPIFHARTTDGEYCITDSLAEGGEWLELPDHSLARFPESGEVEILALDLAAGTPLRDDALQGDPGRPFGGMPAGGPRILVLDSPAGQALLRFRCALAEGSAGALTLHDAQGRSIGSLRLVGSARDFDVEWTPPSGLGSGLVWARLSDGRRSVTAHLVLLR